jgi:pyruvate formate lyase activating enzyme
MKALVGNIQRFCLNDGPGIRTTVFLMGCSLRCPWCCNPENLTSEIKIGLDGTKYGKTIDESNLLVEIKKDKNYYEGGGGVTFSGGECLLSLYKLTNLLSQLKEENINIAIESSLCVPLANFECVSSFIDEFYIDFKILEKNNCKKMLGGDINLFLTNLSYLQKMGVSSSITARIPIVPGYTDNDENLELISKTLSRFLIKHVEIFSVHNLAFEKYQNLSIPYQKFVEANKEELGKVNDFFLKHGFETKILKL